ncbi:MAG: hypothetical protein ACKV0T_12090 [Planctomycetales bacterium]
MLALWAGNDLDAAAQIGAQRHLATCPQCRAHWHGLQVGQQALEQVRLSPAGDASDARSSEERSVWPGVARQLRWSEPLSVAPGWRDWLPVGALAAACLAMVMASWPQATPTEMTEFHSGGMPMLRVNSAAWGQAESLAGSDEWAPLQLAFPDGLRVRTLVDGTDVSGF